MIYHLANCDNSGFVVVTVIHHALLCVVAIRAIRLEKDIDCPIERAHGDIYAVMQHVVFASMWLEAAGAGQARPHTAKSVLLRKTLRRPIGVGSACIRFLTAPGHGSAIGILPRFA